MVMRMDKKIGIKKIHDKVQEFSESLGDNNPRIRIEQMSKGANCVVTIQLSIPVCSDDND